MDVVHFVRLTCSAGSSYHIQKYDTSGANFMSGNRIIYMRGSILQSLVEFSSGTLSLYNNNFYTLDSEVNLRSVVFTVYMQYNELINNNAFLFPT